MGNHTPIFKGPLSARMQMAEKGLLPKRQVYTMADLAARVRRAAAIVLRQGHCNGPEVLYARKALNLTQPALAVKLSVGSSTVGDWETERVRLPEEARWKMVELLEATASAGLPDGQCHGCRFPGEAHKADCGKAGR